MKRKFESMGSGDEPKPKQQHIEAPLFNTLETIPSFNGNHEIENNRLNGGTYTIYTIKTLGELITKARQIAVEQVEKKNRKPEISIKLQNIETRTDVPLKLIKPKDTVTLRFLLSPQFELFFALEGRPSANIPPHFGMTGKDQNAARCITAGNIKIDSQDRINFISNKSGDFQPSWDSLQFGLAALLASGKVVADEIKLEKHGPEACEDFFLDINSLKQKLGETFSSEKQDLYNQINRNLEKRDHFYEKKEDKHKFFQRRLPSRNLTTLLREDDDDSYLYNEVQDGNPSLPQGAELKKKSSVQRKLTF